MPASSKNMVCPSTLVYVASGTKVAQAVIAGEFPVALAGGTVVNATLAGGTSSLLAA
jgi:hypothetical protein